jgi:hypothetical protein
MKTSYPPGFFANFKPKYSVSIPNSMDAIPSDLQENFSVPLKKHPTMVSLASLKKFPSQFSVKSETKAKWLTRWESVKSVFSPK